MSKRQNLRIFFNVLLIKVGKTPPRSCEFPIIVMIFLVEVGTTQQGGVVAEPEVFPGAEVNYAHVLRWFHEIFAK